MTPVRTGDIVCVRSRGPFGFLIRLGAWLQRKPWRDDHTAIVVDDNGLLVQAMVGGVAYGHLADYPARYTISNAGQPKTDEQRQAVAALAKSFLNAPYDWDAITADASNVFDIRDPWVKDWTPDTVPPAVVCSSLAAYVYSKVGLGCPDGGRFVEPCDWVAYIRSHHYEG